MAENNTSGVLYVHSCLPAMMPHMEWALGRALGHAVSFAWSEQPILPGTMRAEFEWQGSEATAALVASSLRGWDQLRFEITQNASAANDGGRWLHTPELGIFYMQLDTAGNTVVPEDRIRSAIENSGNDSAQLTRELRLALGQAWDDELEPFRHAGSPGSLVWLNRASVNG